MKYPKRSQYKYAKSPYRVRNWAMYEASLRRRGDLTIWLSEDAIKSWREPPSGKPGGQRTYANIAIEASPPDPGLLLPNPSDETSANLLDRLATSSPVLFLILFSFLSSPSALPLHLPSVSFRSAGFPP